MPSRTYFAYIRVSTPRQGEGVSLQEQGAAIERYAQRMGLTISRWFEEQDTAAKRGRPVFTAMLRLLREGKAAGVIIHKIDRSTRNLREWAELGEMLDQGVDVHFANESLDLKTRGGRLTADIQAVIAADYIRNLKEEIKKGFYGRLKQGIWPLPAPIGYLDRGAGQPKVPDPRRAPLVREAFELYATGQYNLRSLAAALRGRGLRNRRGGRLTKHGVSSMLNNPFYIGLLRIEKTAETFRGAHQALISSTLFKRVQGILTGRAPTKVLVHDFTYRRLLRCANCQYVLSGSLRKSHIYYRCHVAACLPTTCVREEAIDKTFHETCAPLLFSQDEREALAEILPRFRQLWNADHTRTVHAIRLSLDEVKARIARLTDAYIDRVVEKAVFEERHATLLTERRAGEEQLEMLKDKSGMIPDAVARYFELAGPVPMSAMMSLPAEKRDLVECLTSNRTVREKTVEFRLRSPFAEIAGRPKQPNGGSRRDTVRTMEALVKQVADLVAKHPELLHALPERREAA